MPSPSGRLTSLNVAEAVVRDENLYFCNRPLFGQSEYPGYRAMVRALTMNDKPIQIFGRTGSLFTRLPLIFAEELGVAYDLVLVEDLAAMEPDYYAGNPALRMPVLRVVVSDFSRSSIAIIRLDSPQFEDARTRQT